MLPKVCVSAMHLIFNSWMVGFYKKMLESDFLASLCALYDVCEVLDKLSRRLQATEVSTRIFFYFTVTVNVSAVFLRGLAWDQGSFDERQTSPCRTWCQVSGIFA